VDEVKYLIRRHWGYSAFLPLQKEAIAAAINHRDSLVVLPTGGGKSLCYQVPALLSDRLTVVISPLISLMKDQVTQLLSRGIPAAFLNSSLDPADRCRVTAGIERREFKMIFTAPERLNDRIFVDQLERINVGTFAIDEAHCISHWGHDFRVEYRQLDRLKKRFPNAVVNGFTATATPRVQQDIIAHLGLTDPEILVGDFFRSNLHYHVAVRTDTFEDILCCIRQRPKQAGIVYCIRRSDVDEMTALLVSAGINAVGYHAGMSNRQRTEAQDAFAAGRIDIVVATVAFGMGIHRADLRFVIHAAMPKSIEHYQQETGRAGRDGLPADCILFYAKSDYGLWKSLIEKDDAPNAEHKLALLRDMYRYCTGARCRHEWLVTYFGQSWQRGRCEACDLCKGTGTFVEDSTVIAQKILSCIVRTQQRYGPAYIADLLRGEPTDRALQYQHHRLSTFGLIPDEPKNVLTTWMDQLVDQGMLDRESVYHTLKLSDLGREVLEGQREVRLLPVAGKKTKSRRKRRSVSSAEPEANRSKSVRSSAKEFGNETLDSDAQRLFENLKALRRQIADEQNVPTFIICSDRTLRAMARQRPTSREQMLAVYGIGPAKHDSFGQRFINAIRQNGS